VVASSVKPLPPDFSVLFFYHEGSLPSPDYYEYTILVRPDGSGELRFWPDYPAHHPEPVLFPFYASQAELADLYRQMTQVGLFNRQWRETENPPTGGSRAWIEVTAEQKQYAIPPNLTPREKARAEQIYAAVRALIPPEVWQRLGGKK
jgi:hypothetical protein